MQDRAWFSGGGGAASRAHLQSLSTYRETELLHKQNAVDDSGGLLEFATLELRVHPPNVRVDNESFEDRTRLTIDSANRPGTLVEVVQCLTELGLSVKQARISSDGGWFVDEFQVSETPWGRVCDPKKLEAIRNVLAVPEPNGEPAEEHTVFQITCPEQPGCLAEMTQLLSHNGLEIGTVAAWTSSHRAAVVIGVTERGAAVADPSKLGRLRQLLLHALDDGQGGAAVSVEQVRGPIHHERRLHQLLLADSIHAQEQLTGLQRQHQLAILQRQHSLPFPSTWVAADADAESGQQQQDEQTPRTPKTPPLQRALGPRALSPQWAAAAADGGGGTGGDTAPARDQDQQRQRPQQQAAAGQAGRAECAAEPAGEAVASQDGGEAPPPPRPPAVAAQQASVEKLVALLQPQPLAHAVSLPPGVRNAVRGGQAAAAAAERQARSEEHHRPQEQRQGDQDQRSRELVAAAGDTPCSGASSGGDADGGGSGSSGSSGSSAAEQLGPMPQHALRAPSVLRASSEPASDLTAAAMRATGGAGGLPPRPPATHSGTTGHVASPEAPAAAPGRLALVPASSASAPNSPMACQAGRVALAPPPLLPPPSPRGAAAAAAAAGSGPASGLTLFSPRRFAAASAAAGQLSPRAVRISDSSGGMFGLQQHQPYGASASGGGGGGGGGAPEPAPEITLQHSSLFDYWLVEIHCQDRNKLFFDTVTTLSDMRYDIFHATIDTAPNGQASQLFYVRPRFGSCAWDPQKASLLGAMLTSAVQRRFPSGLRVHVYSGSTGYLQDLLTALWRHRLTITRCKVRAFDLLPAEAGGTSSSSTARPPGGTNASHTFYLMREDGALPTRQLVHTACQSAGGELVEAPLDLANPCVATVLRSLEHRGRPFAFSFVNARAARSAQAAAAGASGAEHHRLLRAGWPLGVGEQGVGGAGGRRGALEAMRSGPAGPVRSQRACSDTGGSYGSDLQPSF